jgi:hypothetical protein
MSDLINLLNLIRKIGLRFILNELVFELERRLAKAIRQLSRYDDLQHSLLY